MNAWCDAPTPRVPGCLTAYVPVCHSSAMTTTTNPATVTAGRCAVSMTSTAKRAALIGRTARHTLADGTVVVGIIDAFAGGYPRMTIAEGPLAGRWTRLDSIVTLVR